MLNPTAYDTVSSPPTVNFIGLDVYIHWQSSDLALFVIWYRRHAKKEGTAAAAEVAGMTGKPELEARTPTVQAHHSVYNGDRVEIGGQVTDHHRGGMAAENSPQKGGVLDSVTRSAQHLGISSWSAPHLVEIS